MRAITAASSPEPIADDNGTGCQSSEAPKEIDTRPTFTLDEQLELVKRDEGPPTADAWYEALGDYLESTGTFQEAPEPGAFIEPKYMEMVANDPKLRAFANSQPM